MRLLLAWGLGTLVFLPIRALGGNCQVELLAVDRRGPASAVVSFDNRFFLATGAAIQTLDATDPWNLRTLSVLNLDDLAHELENIGPLVVFRGSRSLGFVDSSDPSRPALIGSFHLPSAWTALNIAAEGSSVFVATANAGVRVLDISAPASPIEVGSYWLPSAIDVVARGHIAFVTDHQSMYALDVSDTTNPRQIGRLEGRAGQLALSSSGTRLAVFGGLCDAGPSLGCVTFVDVSYPASPIERSTLAFDNEIVDVELANGHAILIESSGDGWVLDLENVHDPIVESHFEVLGPRDLALDYPILAAADAKAGLRVLRHLHPSSTAEIDLVVTPGPTTGGFIQHNVATTFHDFGLRVFDISAPGQLRLLASRRPGVERLHHPVYFNGCAYVASEGQGIRIYDLSRPAEPSTIGLFGPRYATALAVDRGLLLVSGLSAFGTRLFDVSEPSVPELLSIVLPAELGMDVAIDGELAVIWSSFAPRTLRTFDVSTPGSPEPLAIIDGISERSSVIYGSELLFGDRDGLVLFDVGNPAAPTKLSSFKAVEGANSVSRQGRRVGLGAANSVDRDGWFQVVDIDEGGRFHEVFSFDTPGDASGVFVGPGVFVVADGPAGISVFESCAPFADGFEDGDSSMWSLVRP